ncbi:MAG TPA: hypothetical protein VFG52_07290, partial [Xanthomonadales bacterium]|nr:hypothetical protein [Xanthomonadales bacterium]
AGMIYGLAQWGLQSWIILLGMAGLHTLLAVTAWRSIGKLCKNLEFRQTMQQFNTHRENGDV